MRYDTLCNSYQCIVKYKGLLKYKKTSIMVRKNDLFLHFKALSK